MGKDNQPKVRQAAQLARKAGRRETCDRILIVSEGSKTEPLYLNEIRSEYRLSTASVQVQPSQFGTSPLLVVEYAEDLFINGDPGKNIQPRAFERVYAVFDRDEHQSYHNALNKAAVRDGKLRNDNNKPIQFSAVASVPCFELWLLLHFEDVQAPLHRTEAYHRLRKYLSAYDKGQAGHYKETSCNLAAATQRAEHLASLTTAHDGVEPYTDMYRLVKQLTALKT